MEFPFDDPGLLQDGELFLVLVETQPAVPERDRVATYKFEMRVAGSPDDVGRLNFRAETTHNVSMYYGHIGYEVAEPYRGKHLAERAVRLVLPLVRSHGIRALWITCNPDNWASRRTCAKPRRASISRYW